MDTELKKIAFISDHASPLAVLGGVDTGGQNVYVAQLAAHLAAQNYQVDVFTRREDTGTEEVVCWMPGIRVIHVKAGPEAIVAKEELLPHMAEFEHNMLLFINRERCRYDLIHAHFFMSALVAMGIKKQLEIPFIVTFHALGHVRRLHQRERDLFPPERLQIEAQAIAEADHIIAECPQDRDDLINYYQADQGRISIVPCGFNPKEFYPVNRQLARKLLGLSSHDRILLQLGRMVPRKGIDNVIKALARLKTDGVNQVKLMIVGGKSSKMAGSDCAEYQRLKSLCEDFGITTEVEFAGRRSRSHLKLYYSAADIFITTPWYEPFGITPLEAMACGTPVIGSNVGGIKYSVADGSTGALVPPEDPEALAQAIKQLVESPEKLQELSVNAVKRVNKYFTWQNVAKQVLDIYIGISKSMSTPVTGDSQAA